MPLCSYWFLFVVLFELIGQLRSSCCLACQCVCWRLTIVLAMLLVLCLCGVTSHGVGGKIESDMKDV